MYDYFIEQLRQTTNELVKEKWYESATICNNAVHIIEELTKEKAFILEDFKRYANCNICIYKCISKCYQEPCCNCRSGSNRFNGKSVNFVWRGIQSDINLSREISILEGYLKELKMAQEHEQKEKENENND